MVPIFPSTCTHSCLSVYLRSETAHGQRGSKRNFVGNTCEGDRRGGDAANSQRGGPSENVAHCQLAQAVGTQSPDDDGTHDHPAPKLEQMLSLRIGADWDQVNSSLGGRCTPLASRVFTMWPTTADRQCCHTYKIYRVLCNYNYLLQCII